MKPYIYITRKLPEDVVVGLMPQFQIKMWDKEDVPVPRDILIEEASKADALLTMLSDQIDSEVLLAGRSLKVVANLAVGYDNIDIHTATTIGIAVCNTPDVLTNTTADLVFGLLLATARRITEAAEYVKNNQWVSWSPLLLAGQDVHHKTIGIVGMGKIGEAVAKRAKGFEMDILYYNRSRKFEAEQSLGARYTFFDELVKNSDFLVCLTPLTEETNKLFTSEVFQAMKSTTIFINASRGAVVDEDALYHALEVGEIAGAGLDVFENEPIRATNRLLSLTNVVALPHIGSSSLETRRVMMKLCLDNIQSVLEGTKPISLVNQEWQMANVN